MSMSKMLHVLWVPMVSLGLAIQCLPHSGGRACHGAVAGNQLIGNAPCLIFWCHKTSHSSVT